MNKPFSDPLSAVVPKRPQGELTVLQPLPQPVEQGRLASGGVHPRRTLFGHQLERASQRRRFRLRADDHR